MIQFLKKAIFPILSTRNVLDTLGCKSVCLKLTIILRGYKHTLRLHPIFIDLSEQLLLQITHVIE